MRSSNAALEPYALPFTPISRPHTSPCSSFPHAALFHRWWHDALWEKMSQIGDIFFADSRAKNLVARPSILSWSPSLAWQFHSAVHTFEADGFIASARFATRGQKENID